MLKQEVYELIETSWKAIYRDGSSLSQFNENRSENKYFDIDRNRLAQFVLIRNGAPAVVIHLGGNKKLIYRMRRAMDNKGHHEDVYLAGWQEKRNGQNVQMIMALFEDNRVEIVDCFNEKHPWFYSINFLKEEKI